MKKTLTNVGVGTKIRDTRDQKMYVVTQILFIPGNCHIEFYLRDLENPRALLKKMTLKQMKFLTRSALLVRLEEE